MIRRTPARRRFATRTPAPRLPAPLVGALAAVLSALTWTGCGYALAGRGAFLPAYIKVVGVPQFVNHSTVPNIDRILGDAVRAEFQSRGQYRVLPESEGVDAVLTATIGYVTLNPVALTTSAQASRYAITVTANVEFKDLHANKVLWSNPSMTAREEYEITTSASGTDAAAAFLGSDQNAFDRLAKDFARSLVTSILEAF